MNSIEAVLSGAIGFAPAALVELYANNDLPFYAESLIHCLSLEEARDFNKQLSHLPLISRLGLWFLDDANDSNPFAFVSKGPCAGVVLHYQHDDDVLIRFRSLSSFIERLHKTGRQGIFIDEMPTEVVFLPLDSAVFEVAGEEEEEEDTPALVGIYLSACDSLSLRTLEYVFKVGQTEGDDALRE